MPIGSSFVTLIAVTTGRAGVGGVTLIQTGRCRHYTLVDMPIGSSFVTLIAVTAGGTGVGGVTLIQTGGCRHHTLVTVSHGGNHFGFRITAAGAGTGSGTVLGTSSGCFLPCAKAVGATFMDLNICEGILLDQVIIGTHEGKGQIHAGQIIGGFILIGQSLVMTGQRTDFLAIHIQVDHVAAVSIDQIAQAVGVGNSGIDVVIRKPDTVIMMGVAELTDADKIAVSGTQQIPVIFLVMVVGTGEDHIRTGGRTAEALRIPADTPGHIVAQHHGLVHAEIGAEDGIALNVGIDMGHIVARIAVGGHAGHGVIADLPAVAVGCVICRDTIFPDLEIADAAVIDLALQSTHVAEGKVPATDPVHLGIPVGQTGEIIVHGADLHAVHTEVDHVGAVGIDAVVQAIDMGCRAVDANIRQIDAVVAVLIVGTVAKRNQTGTGVAEQIGCIVCVIPLMGRQQHGATGELTLGLPLHDPRAVMPQHHIPAQLILGAAELATGHAASHHIGGIGGQTCAGNGVEAVICHFPAVDVGFVHAVLQALAPDLNVLQIGLIDPVLMGAEVRESQILAGQPVGRGLLAGQTDEIIVHGTNFNAIHTEVDHIGAIGQELIVQLINVFCRSVDAVIFQIDAVVVVLACCAVGIAQSDDTVAGAAKQIGMTGIIGRRFRGQEHMVAARTGGLPLHDPTSAVVQNDGLADTVHAVGHGATGNGAKHM